MNKTRKILHVSVIIFTAEKLFQHLILAIFFLVRIPGIGTPYLGPNFSIDNRTMAVLNLTYTLLFAAGLLAQIQHRRWGMPLIITLAALDIVLEFLFHGLGYITVSVIVSTLLILVSIVYLNSKKRLTHSPER
jgi:hypothetical protein